MALTKRQKMLSSVFLVGLVALAVDRTILRPQGGPQAASARSVAESGPAGAPAGTPAETRGGPMPVAERLNRLSAGSPANIEDVRDPFVLPPSWSDPTATSVERVPDVVRTFTQKHRLRAVVIKDGQYCALIDEGDKFLTLGETLDGFRLAAVTPTSAVFQREGKRAVLDLVVP